MTALEIKAELMLRGITLQAIADQANVTRGAVTQVIHQYPKCRYKGLRIRGYIAQALGRDVEDIWPR
jgi:lambda repressor-like predicted transcriptional regulator